MTADQHLANLRTRTATAVDTATEAIDTLISELVAARNHLELAHAGEPYLRNALEFGQRYTDAPRAVTRAATMVEELALVERVSTP